MCTGILVNISKLSPLAPMKNKNGGGEPGIDLHVILRHNAFALTVKSSEHHPHEDREVAAKYSQLRSLLLQLIFCCVAVLEL